MQLPQFDAVRHVYTLDGVDVPSVTTVLKLSGIIQTAGYNELARQRGVAVHKAISLLVADDLDESSIDPVVAPYVNAYKAFISISNFKPTYSEQVVVSRQYWYSGTFDLMGTLNGLNVLIDIKTGTNPSWVGLQLAAYEMAAQECGYKPAERFSLNLMADGKFKLRHYKNRSDYLLFIQALERIKNVQAS